MLRRALLLWPAAAALAAFDDCAVSLGRRPIHEIDKVTTVICNVSALSGGLIVAGSTPPERGEDWWYGISHDDEVAYTSRVNHSRYDMSKGCKVAGDRLYIPKKVGVGVGVWAITTGHHTNDLSVSCPDSRAVRCWVTEVEPCDKMLYLAVASDFGRHLVAVNASSGRRLWTYALQNVTSLRLRASSLQGCGLWAIFVPQRTRQERAAPRVPVVQAFRLDGSTYYTQPLVGTALQSSAPLPRLSPAGDVLGVVFTALPTKGWAPVRRHTPKAYTDRPVDCLWVINASSLGRPQLLFHSPAGPNAPALRFGHSSTRAYFQSSKVLYVVPTDPDEEVVQFRGAIGSYYVDRHQNLYLVKRDSSSNRLWKVLPDSEVAWHRDIDQATSVLMVCGGTGDTVNFLMTRPRHRSALLHAPSGQLMDVIFLHSTETDKTCAPLVPNSNPETLVIGVLTGAAAVTLLLAVYYFYRRFTVTQVEERWSVASESLGRHRRGH